MHTFDVLSRAVARHCRARTAVRVAGQVIAAAAVWTIAVAAVQLSGRDMLRDTQLVALAVLLLSIPANRALGLYAEELFSRRFPLARTVGPTVSRLTLAEVAPATLLFALGVVTHLGRLSDEGEKPPRVTAERFSRFDAHERASLAHRVQDRFADAAVVSQYRSELLAFIRYSGPVSDLVPLLSSRWDHLSAVRNVLRAVSGSTVSLPELYSDEVIRSVGLPLATAPTVLVTALVADRTRTLGGVQPDLVVARRAAELIAALATLDRHEAEALAALAPRWSGSGEELLAAVRHL
jgi:hypothetical protein